MIRGFKSSRIRGEFVNFQDLCSIAKTQSWDVFPRRAVSQNSTGIRCADTLSMKGDPRL
jgi:hypothetical protein